MEPRRVTSPDDFSAILALITRAFASMHSRINPPSSLASLTIDSLQSGGEVWAAGHPPIACMVLTPHPDHLYLGKLAVDPAMQGQGLARTLIAHADTRARELRLPRLQLLTRIELTENHHTFIALGFTQTATFTHTGHTRPTALTFTKEVPLA
jgi:GNAT superfamily N-acetyltransferase